ncbi:hypothetical protein [Corynebacterium aquilae]|uniref:Uncharacterized protein n=1 Tax=Corynebacterium aquilae DSM 44791 TaxID=1431546 RepID=A0A1L7CD62_9CORY|nr:hypothetical protein [Corynebacterium aquilae]APT83776.1 hypothetical protein CAQU_00245 [Corynebacterium aquilae DSM 44791]
MDYFHLGRFLWMTLISAAIPTAILLAAVSYQPSRPRAQRAPWQGAPGLLAYLLGLVSFVGWLSWNTTNGFEELLHYGPPAVFPAWQVAGCGITLVVGTIVLNVLHSRSLREVVAFAALIAAGCATAMSLAGSFGVTAQEGVGVGFAYIGGVVGAAVVGAVVFALSKLRARA